MWKDAQALLIIKENQIKVYHELALHNCHDGYFIVWARAKKKPIKQKKTQKTISPNMSL